METTTTKTCRCSMKCDEGAYWMGRGLLATCFTEDEECRCHCHAVRAKFEAARKRYDAAYNEGVATGRIIPRRRTYEGP